MFQGEETGNWKIHAPGDGSDYPVTAYGDMDGDRDADSDSVERRRPYSVELEAIQYHHRTSKLLTDTPK